MYQRVDARSAGGQFIIVFGCRVFSIVRGIICHFEHVGLIDLLSSLIVVSGHFEYIIIRFIVVF